MSNIFVAISPSRIQSNAELKQLLGKIKRTLNDREVEARWVPPDLWHVTVAFLGPLAEDRRAQLMVLLDGWRPEVDEFTLRLHGLGGYPTPEQARVLWVGVAENQKFLDLQQHLADFLKSGGFDLGPRPYEPHMTLARLRNPHSLTDVIRLGGRKGFGEYPVREFSVFQTVLQGNNLKYVPIKRLGLG